MQWIFQRIFCNEFFNEFLCHVFLSILMHLPKIVPSKRCKRNISRNEQQCCIQLRMQPDWMMQMLTGDEHNYVSDLFCRHIKIDRQSILHIYLSWFPYQTLHVLMKIHEWLRNKQKRVFHNLHTGGRTCSRCRCMFQHKLSA